MFRHRLRVRWKSKLFQAVRGEKLCLSGFAEQAVGFRRAEKDSEAQGNQAYRPGVHPEAPYRLCVRSGGWAQQVRIISAYR
jgi:hypothetical protein